MLADVVDEGELARGQAPGGHVQRHHLLRHEGHLGARRARSPGSPSTLIDFPRGAAPGSIAPGKVAALGLAVGPGLLALYFVTLSFLSRYPITRERHREILDALDRQRREGARGAALPAPDAR